MADGTVSTEGDMVTFDTEGQEHTGKYVLKYVHYYDPAATAGTDLFVLSDSADVVIVRGIADQAYIDKFYPVPDGRKTGVKLLTLVGGGEVEVAFKLDGARE